MRSSLFHSGALGIALLSGHATAVGFGELTLLSRVGEPLRAEVAIVLQGQEPVDTACFSLAPMRDSDLPVVTSARLQLVKDGRGLRLVIAGKPVADPIFMIALRAGCGVELQRDFVLMPQAPVTTAEALPLQAATGEIVSAPAPVPGKAWRASEGDTLESIAENLVPDDMVKQRRTLVALQRANPGLEATAPLSEGTAVRIPRLRKQAAADTGDGSAARAPRRPAPSSAPQAEAPRPEALPQAAKPKVPPPPRGGDRLVLSPAPADLKPGEKASSRGSLPEMEERMAKMENTLNLLNEEITKLNQALALTTEAMVAQQKLQAAQTAIQTKVAEKDPPPLAVPAPTAAPHPSTDNWIELLLSAVAGGIIAALAAHILALRRKNPVEDELPLAVQASRPHSMAGNVQFVSTPVAQPAPAETTSQLPDPEPARDNVQVTESDSNSLLKIAEIMLSFGRVHDAAETLSLYIKEASPDQVQPWIMLLDLYRRGNMPKEFAVLSSRIRERFNIHVPTWDEAKASHDGLKTLEGYPHIIGYLHQAWGRQECLDFLQDLVTDNRSGQRAGFPLEVIEEIVLLMRVLEDAHGLKRA